MLKKIRTFGKDKRGVTLIEYGLIAALIAVVAAATLDLIGGALDTTFQGVLEDVQNADEG